MTSHRTLAFSLSLSLLIASSASAQEPEAPPEEAEGPAVIEVEADAQGQVEYEYEYEVPEAPEYEITTPQYQDPYYAPQPPQHRPRRYRIPYQEGMEIPPGGQVIKRRRMGLAIPGAVLFAIPYFATVAVWSSDPYIERERLPGSTLIPVFGPFIGLANLSGEYEPGRRAGLAMSGIMQTLGVTMMVFGFIGKQYLVYYADVQDRKLAIQFTPMATRDGGGAALSVAF